MCIPFRALCGRQECVLYNKRAYFASLHSLRAPPATTSARPACLYAIERARAGALGGLAGRFIGFPFPRQWQLDGQIPDVRCWAAKHYGYMSRLSILLPDPVLDYLTKVSSEVDAVAAAVPLLLTLTE